MRAQFRRWSTRSQGAHDSDHQCKAVECDRACILLSSVVGKSCKLERGRLDVEMRLHFIGFTHETRWASSEDIYTCIITPEHRWTVSKVGRSKCSVQTFVRSTRAKAVDVYRTLEACFTSCSQCLQVLLSASFAAFVLFVFYDSEISYIILYFELLFPTLFVCLFSTARLKTIGVSLSMEYKVPSRISSLISLSVLSAQKVSDTSRDLQTSRLRRTPDPNFWICNLQFISLHTSAARLPRLHPASAESPTFLPSHHHASSLPHSIHSCRSGCTDRDSSWPGPLDCECRFREVRALLVFL